MSIDIDGLRDRLGNLLRSEGGFLWDDYLQIDKTPGSYPPPAPSSNLMNEKWRVRIVEWQYQIIDYYNLRRELVEISMSYLDRYIDKETCGEGLGPSLISDWATTPPSPPHPPLSPSNSIRDVTRVDKHSFQLAAMTSLYLALKTHSCLPSAPLDTNSHSHSHSQTPSPTPPPLTLPSLLLLSRGYFSPPDIHAMENTMLTTLSWRLHPPTTLTFIDHYLLLLLRSCTTQHSCEFCSSDETCPLDSSPSHSRPLLSSPLYTRLAGSARFAGEVGVGDYVFSRGRESVKAACCIVVAVDEENKQRELNGALGEEEVGLSDDTMKSFKRSLTSLTGISTSTGSYPPLLSRLQVLLGQKDDVVEDFLSIISDEGESSPDTPAADDYDNAADEDKMANSPTSVILGEPNGPDTVTHPSNVGGGGTKKKKSERKQSAVNSKKRREG